ncbi:hypothetical protein [Microcystis sp. M42BS1]|nr:hypothetical protein [Microcystis sp. M42BS1]
MNPMSLLIVIGLSAVIVLLRRLIDRVAEIENKVEQLGKQGENR